MGQALGYLVAQKLGLKGNDLNAIATLVNAVNPYVEFKVKRWLLKETLFVNIFLK